MRRFQPNSARPKHALVVLLGLLVPCLISPSSHARDRAIFEPEDGKTLLIVGQEKNAIADYWKSVGSAGGYMLYTNLSSLDGMESKHQGRGCSDSGEMSYQDWLKNYPDTAVQIGLYMVGQLADVASGDMDVLIEDLAQLLRASKRPVFLRIGYEFDGPWNRYAPGLYQSAFQRIVKIFRGEKLEGMPAAIEPASNVAFVWHSAAYLRHDNQPLQAWYPGDEYVDWVALSWFEWAGEGDNALAAKAREEVSAFAKAHEKPLMIGEAAPKKFYQADQDNAWSGWYEPVFKWIEDHNVKAFSFINQDWTTMPQWSDVMCGNGVDWGDTRVQREGSTMLQKWQHKVQSQRFLLQGPGTMKAMGFGS